MLGGDCHVAAKVVVMGISEANIHRIRKDREVQKSLLITLHANTCRLRFLISSNTEHSYYTEDRILGPFNSLP